MWPCCGVHITVCMAQLVFVLCQPVHSCGLDFFLEVFLWRLVSVLFWLCCTTHAIAVDVSSLRTCALTNGIQQPVRSAPQSSPQEITGVRSQLHSKRSSKGTSSENFLTTGGFFEYYIHLLCYGARLFEEERKKMNNSDFRSVSGLPL